jgi:hypothetical protein
MNTHRIWFVQELVKRRANKKNKENYDRDIEIEDDWPITNLKSQTN